MAAIGKIRSWGPFLIGVIGLGLFGFIAGDMFRSCETTSRNRSNRVGEVVGEKINAQDYQTYLEEFVECTKITAPQASDDQLREAAWQNFVQNKIIENEAAKLGLTVTKEEIQNVMKQGTNQVLMEMANVNPEFANQQTGRFDVFSYQKFMTEGKTQYGSNPQTAEQYNKLYKFFLFKEKQLRQQLLAQKYQTLMSSCILSNPVEAKFNFDAEKQESDIQLAYFDYKSINDKDVKVTDADLEAKYNERKEVFRIQEEIRAIKFVQVKKVASAADRAELTKELNKVAEQLKTTDNAEQVVRESKSNVSYLGVPVTKNAFTPDVARQIDSLAVGATVGPVESTLDNTLNVIKLLAKNSLPDSIQYRMIIVGGKTADETKTRADSVLNAVKAGGDFEAIAKVYGQNGEKQWLTTSMYERAANLSADDRAVYNAMNTQLVGETSNIAMVQGNVILQICDRKAMTTKYDVAVVKRNIAYSTETSNEITNKFNQFVAANQSAESFEQNAPKSGFQVRDAKNVTTSQGEIPGLVNSREALRWVFAAEKGDVSQVFTTGQNRDELIAIVLTDIYPKGYMPLSNEDVKNYVEQEVMRDKKAEMLMAKANGLKSINDAKAKGAKVVEVKQITFASPAFISEVQAQEPALSGAVCATEKGKFSAHPVKGNQGVYVFQVTDRRKLEGAFDVKSYENKSAQGYMSMFSRMVFNDLVSNAHVTDNRYLFF